MNDYDISARIKSLNIRCEIDPSVTLDLINKRIHEQQECVHDNEKHHSKIHKLADMDTVNYNLCVKKILKCFVQRKLHHTVIFSFCIDEECPLTNYSYLTIFFGATNEHEKSHKYPHVLNGIADDVLLKIYLDKNDKIRFDCISL